MSRTGALLAVVFAVLALAVPSGPTSAQDAGRPFRALEGAWDGTGIMFGSAAAFTMEWKRHHGMVVLLFRNALTPTDGPRQEVLSASAIYRTNAATPEAVWLDSRGARLEIRWEATDTSLVSVWTNAEETGRTTYVLRGADDVTVTDEVMSDGTWRVFGRATYRRRAAANQPPPPTVQPAMSTA
jgi:hypothetical protein